MSAIEMPPAINFGSPVPKSVMDWKVSIIPMTVPRRPVKGATVARIFITGKPFDISPTSSITTTSNFLDIVSKSSRC